MNFPVIIIIDGIVTCSGAELVVLEETHKTSVNFLTL
jgi:hypothetical protein